VGMVVGSEEQVADAILSRYDSEKTSHVWYPP
jgi:hypothetical protein